MFDPLSRSAILYGTDKFGLHDYTPNYHKMFKHLTDAKIKVLEIGVGGYADDDRGGQSLEVWRDFFPNAEITGIDIQKKTMDLGPRVKILQGSQVDPEFLKELVAERGPFDIIVDDGSHRNEHIVESFQLLFPTLNPGGIYVAEDVQTSFHPRFGGSLEMTEPNSVGYFGTLQRQLSVDSKKPLIADVAAMERFHNMIAMHKKVDGKAHDAFASNLFEVFADHPPAVHCVGGKAPKLPFESGKITTADWSDKDAMKGKMGTDLLICTLSGKTGFDLAAFEKLFASVADGGVMVVRSTKPKADFAPDGDWMSFAQQRFTMVDHVEIKVHYPEAPIDDLAGQIYSIERYADAILFHKSPNQYPSNFAYDARNAQAARALGFMGEVLGDATTEGGLVHYAEILTRYISREDAKETIEKLTELGASSRQYYQMAGALAQRERRFDDALAIFQKALEKFENDPHFSANLSGVYGALRQPDMAEQTLRDAYAANPRARNVISALSRLLGNKDALEEAIGLVESTVTLFPQHMRPGRMTFLSELLRRQDNVVAAEASIQTAYSAAPDDALVLQEMGKVMLAKDNAEAARDFVAQALAKAPENAAIKAFYAELAD